MDGATADQKAKQSPRATPRRVWADWRIKVSVKAEEAYEILGSEPIQVMGS